MAETAEVETAPEQTGEAQETASQNQTLENMVDEAKAEATSEVSKPEADKERRPNKLTASERIRQLNDQKKVAEGKATELESQNRELSSGMDSLRSEILGIKEMLASGQMSRSEATQAVTDAKEVFLDGINPDDLPYGEEMVKIATQIARRAIDTELAPIRQAEKQRETEATDRRVKDFQAERMSDYVETSKDYPELFSGMDKDGLPELKPEYDKQLTELATKYNTVHINPKTGKEFTFNPVTSTKEGIRMLMDTVYKSVDRAKTVKSEIGKANSLISQVKKGRVESPEASKGPSSKKLTLQEIVENTVKEYQ